MRLPLLLFAAYLAVDGYKSLAVRVDNSLGVHDDEFEADDTLGAVRSIKPHGTSEEESDEAPAIPLSPVRKEAAPSIPLAPVQKSSPTPPEPRPPSGPTPPEPIPSGPTPPEPQPESTPPTIPLTPVFKPGGDNIDEFIDAGKGVIDVIDKFVDHNKATGSAKSFFQSPPMWFIILCVGVLVALLIGGALCCVMKG